MGMVRWQVPMSTDTIKRTKDDVEVVLYYMLRMHPDYRRFFFMDYLEELTAGVVGAERSYAFFRYCFRCRAHSTPCLPPQTMPRVPRACTRLYFWRSSYPR